MKILINIDCLERLRFFTRLANALEKKGVTCIFITPFPSIALRGSILGKCIRLIKPKRYCSNALSSLSEEFFEVRCGDINQKEAEKSYLSSYNFAYKLIKNYGIEGCIIWNGEKLTDKAIRDVAKDLDIKTIFLEITNFSGKLFVDPMGPNARSSIAKDPNLLCKYHTSEQEYQHWREKYIENKRKQISIPQAYRKSNLGMGLIINTLSSLIGLSIVTKHNSVKEFIKEKLRSNFNEIIFDSTKETADHVLYPMQVSSDTQLVVNAKMTNEYGIMQASRYAARKGVPLIVKLHPAENDASVYEKIIALRKDINFLITNEPIYDLIERSSLVVTINSTVGLESIIIGRNVKVLAESYYRNLSYKQIQSLIMRYFVDVDYFGNKDISPEATGTILDRLNRKSA